MKSAITSRVSLAGAVALLALAAAGAASPTFAAEQEQPTRCYGINSCKGESLCATAKHDCKGLNTCKGEGVLVRTPSECKKLGGTLTEKE